jgi:sulfhydrogenase subunit alpha
MHQGFDLTIKNISKIEGHTHLDVKVRNGKVTESKLKISENKRFFTQAIRGLDYKIVPSTMSRICGTCSSAHTLCSIEAIEKALGIETSEQTFTLRKLLINGGHLRDHAMHLYFFCLPDLFKKDSVLDFNEKEHSWIHDGLDIKSAGNALATLIGGRAIHPTSAGIGGFTAIPEKIKIKEVINQLNNSREKVIKIIDLFYNHRIKFERKTNYVALVNNDFNFLKGTIKTARGSLIPEEQYGEHLERVVLPYSTATAFEFESKEYMVGALARMNLNKNNLHEDTLKDCRKYLSVFPSDCIFKNNLAQAIEMLHEIDSSIEMLEKNNFTKEKPQEPIKKGGLGVGVVEAPRGTLYYKVLIEKNKVRGADLCIPTQQNIIHMEKDIKNYVQKNLNKKKEKLTLEVEELIRAYDPCMSCATHFLRINWT